MKAIRTWILVADGTRARVLESTGPGRRLTAHPELTFSHELPRHEPGGSDRGRAFESASPTRHAVEPKSDPVRQSKHQFAIELADMLAGKLTEKAFDRVVLVAPAPMMGDLRTALDAPVRAVVSGEVVADLTKVPDVEIAKHLGDVPGL